MLIKSKEKMFEMRTNMKGGEGSIPNEMFLPTKDLPPHNRIFGEMTLRPGCSIGSHTHVQEAEIYYILEGTGVLDDNGIEREVTVGDCGICYAGESHAIYNRSNDILRVLACIITENA